jgi:carbon storage regulator
MLVLTRKPGERVEIGGVIEVKVVSVQGNRVRLGISAPSRISIRRGELDDQASAAEPVGSRSESYEIEIALGSDVVLV